MSDRLTLVATDAPECGLTQGGEPSSTDGTIAPSVSWDLLGQTLVNLEHLTGDQTGMSGPAIHLTLTASGADLFPHPLPPRLSQSLEHLVGLVAKLRSPDGGWPSHLPQTPQNLAPYVSEEAYEVLEALQDNNLLAASAPSQATSGPFTPPLIMFQDWLPRLLWEAAHSSHAVMQLLGGIQAEIFQPGQDWQSGLLRLALILEGQTSGTAWTLDIASGQPLFAELATDTLLRSHQSRILQKPAWTVKLLAEITDLLHGMAPSVTALLEERPVDLLPPGQNWQTGYLRLRLGFEFTPDAVEPSISAPGTGESLLETTMQLTEATWIDGVLHAIAQQHLIHALITCPLPALPNRPETDALPESVLLLVRATQTAIELASGTHLSFEPIFSEAAIALPDLILRLLWCVTRSSYAVARLVGGVSARYLQPECDWQTGQLRLRPSLLVRSLVKSRAIDLGGGPMPQPSIAPLFPNAVVQLTDCDLHNQPMLVETLLQQVIQHIQRDAPEIAWLLQETAVKLQRFQLPSHSDSEPGSSVEPGWMQLQLDWEFLIQEER